MLYSAFPGGGVLAAAAPQHTGCDSLNTLRKKPGLYSITELHSRAVCCCMRLVDGEPDSTFGVQKRVMFRVSIQS